MHREGTDTRQRKLESSVAPCLARFCIGAVGLDEAYLGYHFQRSDPYCPMVLACHAGQGQVWVQGRWRTLGPGESYVTPPGIPHAYQANRKEAWRLAWVAYGVPTIRREQPGVSRPAAEVVAGDNTNLVRAVEGLIVEAAAHADAAAMLRWAELVDIECKRIDGKKLIDMRLVSLWDEVEASPGEAWSIDALTGRTRMSGEHLRRLCRKYYGHSPMEHVLLVRMRVAAQLLASPENTVDLVSQRVGYSSAFAFSQAFKRVMGKPPSEYRKLYRLRSSDRPSSAAS